MSVFNTNGNYWVNHGTVQYGTQQNVGERASFNKLSKSILINGFKWREGTTDSSSPLSTIRSMSISERTALDEQSSHGAVPFNPVRSAYAPQMQQIHTQPVEIHYSQSFGFDQRYQMPYYYYHPVQMVVTSPNYLNMIPVQSPISPMTIPQPQVSGTSLVSNAVNYQLQGTFKDRAGKPVFTPQHTIIDPSSNSLVTDSSLHSSIVNSSNASAPFENFVSSSHLRSYYNKIKPVLSPAFSVGALEVPPIMQLNVQEMQVNPSQDHISFSILTDPKLQTHGVASVKTAHECNVPGRALTQLKPASQNFPGQASGNNEENVPKATVRKEHDDVWPGTCTYVESEQNSGSTLFVTWFSSRALLVGKLRNFKFEVKHIHSTSDNSVFNVVFESHACARKAFTMQRTIQVRMVPPKKSYFKWARNPSPKFLVKYETMRTLTIRNGKAESNDIVGVLLASKSKDQKRCFVWADQLKGHRIRIVGCEGSLKYKDGTIVKMTGFSNKFEGVNDNEGRMQSLGWVSYRSQYSNEMFVKRRSGNLLTDYIYRG